MAVLLGGQKSILVRRGLLSKSFHVAAKLGPTGNAERKNHLALLITARAHARTDRLLTLSFAAKKAFHALSTVDLEHSLRA
jgi:hypothetical protein